MVSVEIKVMTYNIQHGRGMDNKVSLQRIATVIRNENPDVVGINEVDKFNIRSWFVNQPALLARWLNMQYFFGRNLKLWMIRYGNVLLSRHKITRVENIILPGNEEPRGFIKANLEWAGQKIRFINTHLGLDKEERSRQLARLEKDIRVSVLPVILTGDFNCGIDELSLLTTLMQDCGEQYTFPADNPTIAIDHIMCSRHFDIIDSYTVNAEVSDHLPLVSVLQLKKS